LHRNCDPHTNRHRSESGIKENIFNKNFPGRHSKSVGERLCAEKQGCCKDFPFAFILFFHSADPCDGGNNEHGRRTDRKKRRFDL